MIVVGIESVEVLDVTLGGAACRVVGCGNTSGKHFQRKYCAVLAHYQRILDITTEGQVLGMNNSLIFQHQVDIDIIIVAIEEHHLGFHRIFGGKFVNILELNTFQVATLAGEGIDGLIGHHLEVTVGRICRHLESHCVQGQFLRFRC